MGSSHYRKAIEYSDVKGESVVPLDLKRDEEEAYCSKESGRHLIGLT